MSAALALVEAEPRPFALVRALNRLRAAGFALSVRDSRLMASPFTRLSAQQRGYLRAHKAALVELLEDAESLHRALLAAGTTGLGWRESTPADWSDGRLLAAGEVLYGDGRAVNVRERRYASESAPLLIAPPPPAQWRNSDAPAPTVPAQHVPTVPAQPVPAGFDATVVPPTDDDEKDDFIAKIVADLIADGWNPRNARAKAAADWLWRWGPPRVAGLSVERATR